MLDEVPNRGPRILITCILVPILSTIFVSLRVWTRAFISRSLAWDDYVAVLTLPFCIAHSVCIGITTRYGMGSPDQIITPEIFVEYSKWCYISAIPYLVSLLGYKMAILLLYLRLFHVDQKFKYATWAVMFFVFAYLFSNFLIQFLGCTPLSENWTHATSGHCIDLKMSATVYASMNVISDFFIFVLPLPPVWHLKLTRKEKIGVYLVLMTGALAFVVAIVRFTTGVRHFYPADYLKFASQKASRSELEINTVLEINTGLICGCTPALKHFLRYFSSRSAPADSWQNEKACPDDRPKRGGHINADSCLESGIAHEDEITLCTDAGRPSSWRTDSGGSESTVSAGEKTSRRVEKSERLS